MSSFLFNVAVRDEPGALARMTQHLQDSDVNLKGFVVDPAGMQLLVQDEEPLARALDHLGLLYRSTPVQEILLEDRPGALAEVCSRLADERIGIVTAFGVSTGSGARLYLDLDDLERAAPILAAHSQGTSILHRRLGRIGPATR